jgi:hypothetical protein
MATTAFSFDLNKEFDPNWEEDSAQRIFSGMTDPEKKQVDQTVVETGVKSLQPERSYTPAKEGKGRLTSDMTGNPLDDFEAPLKKEAPKEAPVVESEESDEPPSIGRIISDGYNYISQVKMVQSGRTGRNSREVAREKALDNQAIFQAYSAMQDRLSERGYDRGLVDVLGTHKGGGLRSAEDIDRLFEIKAKGLEYRTQDGIATLDKNAPWGAVLEAADKVGGITIMKPSDPLKMAQDLRSQRIQLTEAISKEGVGEEDKKTFRAEINRVDRQLNSLVSPEERAYEFAENSQNIFNMARNYDDTSKNFEGEVITKDSANKTTPALKFTEEVLSRSIPSITVIKSPSGEYELSNKSEVETYFKDRNLPVPSRFPTGVYIKDGKGLSAPLPAIIDFSKDGEPELTWAVDPAKYIQSNAPTPVQDQKGRKARPEVPSGGVSYAEEPETWMDRYPEDFKNFYGPIAKGIAKPFNRSDQEQYNLSLEKLEELNAILEKAPENIAAIKQRNIHAETINKLLSEGKVKVKPGTGKAPGDPEGKIQWVNPLSNQ